MLIFTAKTPSYTYQIWELALRCTVLSDIDKTTMWACLECSHLVSYSTINIKRS